MNTLSFIPEWLLILTMQVVSREEIESCQHSPCEENMGGI